MRVPDPNWEYSLVCYGMLVIGFKGRIDASVEYGSGDVGRQITIRRKTTKKRRV